MRQVNFSPRALAEYETAATWYAKQNPVAARRVRLSKFPSFLYYFATASGVHIVAIVHTHRPPEAWIVPPELETSQD